MGNKPYRNGIMNTPLKWRAPMRLQPSTKVSATVTGGITKAATVGIESWFKRGWRKPITHCTLQLYFWCTRLRSDARRVVGPDHWVRFWVGRLRLPHHPFIAGMLVLKQDYTFLRSCSVLDRPNTSEFMCNLYWTPYEKHIHSSSIRLISNAYKNTFWCY